MKGGQSQYSGCHHGFTVIPTTSALDGDEGQWTTLVRIGLLTMFSTFGSRRGPRGRIPWTDETPLSCTPRTGRSELRTDVDRQPVRCNAGLSQDHALEVVG